MNLLDDTLTKIRSEFAPHLTTARETLTAWAFRFEARLDELIHLQAQSNPGEETLRIFYKSWAASLADDEIGVVPEGEEWAIESVTFYSRAAGGGASGAGAELVLHHDVGRGRPFYVTQLAAAAADNQAGDTAGGTNVRIPGGETILASVILTQPAIMRLQVRRFLPRQHARPNVGGLPQTADRSAPPTDQATILHRHSSASPQDRSLIIEPSLNDRAGLPQ